MGAEVGKDGTPHYQGYLRFRSQRTIGSVIKKLRVMDGKLIAKKENETNNVGNDVQIARAGDETNRRYCSKGEETEHWREGRSLNPQIIIDHGTPSAPGTRNDLHSIRDMIMEGATMNDVVQNTTSYQGLKAAAIYLTYCETKRNVMPTVVWLWGRTGTGKTLAARQWLPDAWMSGKSLRWWQGYDGQKDVIIDDFRGDFCTFHELLRILDRNPYTVEVKGGSRQLKAERIVITSPYPPQLAYRKCGENIGQLMRRINEKGFCLEVTREINIQEIIDSGVKNDSEVKNTINGTNAPVTRVTERPGGLTQRSGVIVGIEPDPDLRTSRITRMIEEARIRMKNDTYCECDIGYDEDTENRIIAWARGNGFTNEEIRTKTFGGYILMLEWAKSLGFTDYS